MPRLTYRLLLLLALLAFTLFPLEWLGLKWHPLGVALGTLFPTDHAHTVGHALLYSTLGASLLIALPALRTRVPAYLLIVLAAGLGQEAFQLAFKHRPVAYDDVRDLAVDLTAATAVFIAA